MFYINPCIFIGSIDGKFQLKDLCFHLKNSMGQGSGQEQRLTLVMAGLSGCGKPQGKMEDKMIHDLHLGQCHGPVFINADSTVLP